MSLCLYLDEDAQDADLVRILRARGVDVATVNEKEMQRRSDEEQLAFATSLGRVIVTFNIADFRRIRARWMTTGRSHSGIIVAEQRRYSVGEKANRVIRLAAVLKQEQMNNRIEFLSNW